MDSYQILYPVYFYPDYTARNADAQCYNTGEIVLLLIYRKLLDCLKLKYSPPVFLRSFLYLYSNIILTGVFLMIFICTDNIPISMVASVLLAVLMSSPKMGWYDYCCEYFLAGIELFVYLFLIIGLKYDSLAAVSLCGFFLTINLLFKPLVPFIHLASVFLYLLIFTESRFIITFTLSVLSGVIPCIIILKLFIDLGFWFRKIIHIFDMVAIKKLEDTVGSKWGMLIAFFSQHWFYAVLAAGNILNILLVQGTRAWFLSPLVLGLVSAFIIVRMQGSKELYYTLLLLCMTVINAAVLIAQVAPLSFSLMAFAAYLIIDRYVALISDHDRYYIDYHRFNYNLLPLPHLYDYMRCNTAADDRIAILGFDISLHTEIMRKSVTGYLSFENLKILKETRKDFFETLIANLKRGDTKYLIRSFKNFSIDELSMACGYRYVFDKKIGIYDIYRRGDALAETRPLVFDQDGKPNILAYDTLDNYRPYLAVQPRPHDNYYSAALADVNNLKFLIREFISLMRQRAVKEIHIWGCSALAELLIRENNELVVNGVFDTYNYGGRCGDIPVKPADDIRSLDKNSVVVVCTSVNPALINKAVTRINPSVTLIFLYEFLEIATDYFFQRYCERRHTYEYSAISSQYDYILEPGKSGQDD